MLQRLILLGLFFGVLAFLGISCSPPSGGGVAVTPPVPVGEKSATIVGNVKDCLTEKPLPGTEIKIEYQEGGILLTSTDSEGFFEIRVPLGKVTITVYKPGYTKHFFYANLDTPGGILRLMARLCPEE